MNRTALVIVDLQHDFTEGSLGGEGRSQIVRPISYVARDVHRDGGVVIASRDWHPADHCSFSSEPKYIDGSWPSHCVQGTKGAAFVSSACTSADYIVSKGMDKDREQYSAAEATDVRGRTLLEILAFERITDIIVTGLCTDYCVLHTVYDLTFESSLPERASQWWGHVTVPLDCVAGVDPIGTAKAIDAFAEWAVVLDDAHVVPTARA